MLPHIVTSPSLLAVVIGSCLYVQQYLYASATFDGVTLQSRTCIRRISSKLDTLGNGCVTPICGPLNTTGDPFEEQLTPTCRAVLDQYRGKDLSSFWDDSLAHLRGCQSFSASLHPTNPIVVQNKHTASFGFCSVPKAACSQLRSLLFVITRHPDPVNWCASPPQYV
jgi:hypothetical protein